MDIAGSLGFLPPLAEGRVGRRGRAIPNLEETSVDRRSFIKNSAALGAGLGATTLAAPAIAQGNQTWRMVTTWPKNFPGLGVGAQRMADRITAASGGRLTVQVYSAGELVPALQSLDAVIDGTAEMSHSAAYYWQNKSTALSLSLIHI